MRINGTCIVMAAAVAIFGGCQKEVPLKLTATAKVYNDVVVIKVEGRIRHRVKVALEGVDKKYIQGASTKRKWHLDPAGFPVGKKSTVTVVATREETKKVKRAETRVSVSFETKPPRPTLRLVKKARPSSALEVGCDASFSGSRFIQFALRPATGDMLVTMTAGPTGSKLKVNDKLFTVQKDRPISVPINITRQGWDQAPRDAGNKKERVADITITTPDNQVRKHTINCYTGSAVKKQIWQGMTRPVLAPGEKMGKAIGMISKAGGARVIGAAKTMRDIHLLAKRTMLPSMKKSCGRYVGRKTGVKLTITNKAEVLEVKVVDRRTARELAKKVFKAKMPRCPKTTKYGARARVPRATVDRWLEGVLARAR